MNLLHTIGLMTRAEHEAAIREAFKAGWRTNAVGEETHSAEYLDGCEQLDFEEYRRLGIALYIGSLVADDGGAEPTDWEAKFKRAATDLAAQATEKANLEFSLSTHKASLVARTKALDTCEDQNEKLETIIAGLQDEIAALRPDAEAMRKKRAADRKRMAGKRGKA